MTEFLQLYYMRPHVTFLFLYDVEVLHTNIDEHSFLQ